MGHRARGCGGWKVPPPFPGSWPCSGAGPWTQAAGRRLCGDRGLTAPRPLSPVAGVCAHGPLPPWPPATLFPPGKGQDPPGHRRERSRLAADARSARRVRGKGRAQPGGRRGPAPRPTAQPVGPVHTLPSELLHRSRPPRSPRSPARHRAGRPLPPHSHGPGARRSVCVRRVYERVCARCSFTHHSRAYMWTHACTVCTYATRRHHPPHVLPAEGHLCP